MNKSYTYKPQELDSNLKTVPVSSVQQQAYHLALADSRTQRKIYPHGWFIVEARCEIKFAALLVTLVFQSESGGLESESIDLPVSRDGFIKELIYLPPGVTTIAVVVASDGGGANIGDVSFSRIGRVAQVYTMLRKLVPVFRKYPKYSRRQVGLTLSGLFSRLYQKYRLVRHLGYYAAPLPYAEWIEYFDTVHSSDNTLPNKQRMVHSPPTIFTVVVPADAGLLDYMFESIASVEQQSYPFWQLCAVVTTDTSGQVVEELKAYAKRDSRIQIRTLTAAYKYADAVNLGIESAEGEYVLVLEPSDTLSEDALYHYSRASATRRGMAIVYADEDQIDGDGRRHTPYFKPDWNPDLFYSNDYIGRARIYRRKRLLKVSGLSADYPGAEQYALCLRLLKSASGDQIQHIPGVLYHRRVWDEKTGSPDFCNPESGLHALQQHCATSSGVEIEYGNYHRHYPVSNPVPQVSIIIPTRDQCELLRNCVKSIIEKTTYPNWEILIVDNQSVEQDALDYLSAVTQDARIRVLRYPHAFNYSAINNFAVTQAGGELIALLNNDVQVISPGWLHEMVSHALRPEIGAVGAKLYYGSGRIQHAGIVLGIMGVAGHGHKMLPGASPGYHGRLFQIQNVSAVSAACLVVRRELYDAVGGLDERSLKVAYNDVDFCLKLDAAGYRNLWTPYAELYHHESVSRGRRSNWVDKYRMRKEVKVMRKRWGERLLNDLYYNPYLTLEREDFTLSLLPRINLPPGPQ